MKIITQNRKAFFDYHILDTIEAGVVLNGDEVKSLRAGHVSLVGSFATFKGDELYLINCNITPYEKAYQKVEEQSSRARKLLLHRQQLRRLIADVAQKGVTLIPLKIYLNEKGRIKVEIGIAKHKKAAGKKEAIKERDIRRETARELKNYKRG